jgi:hypothetical protein
LLRGQATVFLSCSERFKEQVAFPIRQALRQQGVFGVIVSEEPTLPRTSGEPDSKVESYLDASDAFVALCTPDDRLEDGSIQSRQNIIDEMQRARQKPHLRERIQVFKEPSVRLPSNINPTYERLEVDNVAPVGELIVRQLDSWGILAAEPHPAPAPAAERPEVVRELTEGLGLGEHDEAARRAYKLLTTQARAAHEAAVAELRRYLRDSDDTEQTLLAGSVLEAINRLDPSLIDIDIIEELANSNDFSKRSSAAILLWDRAEAAPATVPLGLLGRLARPATEDWYVQAPAMAAAKQLLLQRRAARIVFDDLAKSGNSEDRYAVASALLDVSHFDKWAVPRDLAEQLARDDDALVAAKGREVLEAIADRPPEGRDPLSPFGL